jgi:outer membrane protein assembly factor BamB
MQSPFEYHSPAPVSSSAQIVLMKNGGQLFTLRVFDGDLHFISNLGQGTLTQRNTSPNYSLLFVDKGVAYILSGEYNNLTIVRLKDGQQLTSSGLPTRNISDIVVRNGVGYAIAESSIYAFDTRTYTLRWKDVFTDTPYPNFSSIIGVDDDLLYIRSSHALTVRRITDGKVLWTFTDEKLTVLSLHSSSSPSLSPITSTSLLFPQSEKLYITLPNYEVIKLNKKDGKIDWRMTNISLGMVDHEHLYVTLYNPTTKMSDALAEVNGSDGKVLWQIPTPVFGNHYILDNGNIYIAGNSFYAINGNDGTQLWHSFFDTCKASSQISVENGVMFASGFGGDSLCTVDIKNGKLLWAMKKSQINYSCKQSNRVNEIISLTSTFTIKRNSFGGSCHLF